jgi:hypothetical protein
LTALRPLLAAPACSLVVLLLVAPSVAADLAVDTQSGPQYDIYTHGSSSLAAPRNTTILPVWGGYVVDWQTPSALAGQEVAGYTIYRLPAPGTEGSLVVTHLSPRQTAYYDRPGSGTYVYFVTAVFSGVGAESVPSQPVSTRDTNYPHCNVVGVYVRPPFYDTHIGCLWPMPA